MLVNEKANACTCKICCRPTCIFKYKIVNITQYLPRKAGKIFQLFMLQMNYARYMEILKSMTSVGGSDDYRLLFSLRPVILLAASLFVWLLVFVFVLLYMMEDSNKSEWHSAKLK